MTGSEFTDNTAKYGGAVATGTLAKDLNIKSSSFKDNQAKSYALKTQNYTVKQGQTANITVYLEYGDNFPGIYAKKIIH